MDFFPLVAVLVAVAVVGVICLTLVYSRRKTRDAICNDARSLIYSRRKTGDELYWAARLGHLDKMHLLYEQGTDINQIVCIGTALGVATYYNQLDIVRYLVEQGADMEKADILGETPLMNASDKGHLEITRYLLEQGADRDMANNVGHTPLHYAAQFDQLEIAKLLMVYGADVNAKDRNGKLPNDIAATEEIELAIRDEPRRRMDHGYKRATEQDRHPTYLALAQQEDRENDGDESQSNKKPFLDNGGEDEEEGYI